MAIASAVSPTIRPKVAFPTDPALHDLSNLFDAEWIWDQYRDRFGHQDWTPEVLRLRQFSHRAGSIALASYLLEYDRETFLPSQHLTIKTERGRGTRLFRYPEDDRLPALAAVAEPDAALSLVNEHVLAMRARRIRVQLIRYRFRSRAVFRHSVDRMRLYARVVRPRVVDRMTAAHGLVGDSRFVVPRLTGSWADGGVLWFSEIPGKNLRQQILKGRMPDTEPLLDGLESLWAKPVVSGNGEPFNLAEAYRTARRTFVNKAGDYEPATRQLTSATEMLNPFVRSWRPTHFAHNDFYDDQMLGLPDGRVALVDFEEAGPGDPMLDVGNCLGHLKWSARLSRRRKRNASNSFHKALKSDALERFQWNPKELALREAVCLFRTCTNVIRHPSTDWRQRLVEGLSLVNETLRQAD